VINVTTRIYGSLSATPILFHPGPSSLVFGVAAALPIGTEEEEDCGVRRLIQGFEKRNDVLAFGLEAEAAAGPLTLESDASEGFWIGRGFGRGGRRNSAASARSTEILRTSIRCSHYASRAASALLLR